MNYPLYGTFLELEGLRPDLAGVTAVALSGKSQKVAVADGVTGAYLPSRRRLGLDDPESGRHLDPGRSRVAAAERGRLDPGRPLDRPAAARDDFECRGRERPARAPSPRR